MQHAVVQSEFTTMHHTVGALLNHHYTSLLPMGPSGPASAEPPPPTLPTQSPLSALFQVHAYTGSRTYMCPNTDTDAKSGVAPTKWPLQAPRTSVLPLT